MSTQELLAAINHLSPIERLTLLEALARSLREELQQQRAPVPVSEIRGIAKPDATPPSDDDLKEDYTRYLMEKYL